MDFDKTENEKILALKQKAERQEENNDTPDGPGGCAN